ncbi:hypothetical protein, partial [Actinophytocola sp.]|uniref:hypothetical protein n=1 Tax=Actinophytocola sp. TaxID=1872138 RepID=UPI002ED8555A
LKVAPGTLCSVVVESDHIGQKRGGMSTSSQPAIAVTGPLTTGVPEILERSPGRGVESGQRCS